MTYRAKIDWWIIAALGLGVLGPFCGFRLWLTIPLFLAVGICGYPQCYETTARGLVIRAGLTRRTIPYEAIQFVGPAAQTGLGLTLAVERVRVQYGENAYEMIAPDDRDAFLADVAARAPQLTRRGRDLLVFV
jgi:hypothetical protein